jgi:hypothetical protein
LKLPTTPEGWAIHLSKLVKIFHDAHGLNRFPIRVTPIAEEYSRNVFPDAPITMVKGLDLSDKFEGMLMPHPDRTGEWGIIYNSAITSKGRINFTLGHELGHYLLHRHLSPDGFRCSSRNMLDWKSEHGQIEAQANTFASYLLMPLDDFREHVRSQEISLALIRFLSERYEVSITAAILKWLGITHKRAMIVVGKDGFIDWAWGSDRLFKSGIFYRARQEAIPLPEQSLARRRDPSIDSEVGIIHPKGIWIGNEEVHEMTVFASRTNMTVSLLLYNDTPTSWRATAEFDEEHELDTYDRLTGLRSL